jgi:hypothetical protein
MTLRQVAVATAHHWGILPHVIWKYPFRYFKELRDAYIATFQAPVEQLRKKAPFDVEGDKQQLIEFDAELFRGDSL